VKPLETIVEGIPQHARIEEVFTFKADKELAFRLYPDNRPRNLEIAALQKGIVLMSKGAELIEEGAGFGVPIAMYADCTFFSSTAQIYLEELSEKAAVISKVYFLDTVSRKQLRGSFINEGLYSLFHKTFTKAYLNTENLRPVFDWIMSFRKALGVETQFVKAASKGKVTVTYTLFPDAIKVHVDLSALDKARCREILILNEQGASVFRKHTDSEGTVLRDKQIGGWAKVTAKQASFSDVAEQISFSLENIRGATLYRGREQIKGRFSWTGMTYGLNPHASSFDYTIKLAKPSYLSGDA
jgi:hypothetical protein